MFHYYNHRNNAIATVDAKETPLREGFFFKYRILPAKSQVVIEKMPAILYFLT